ncbi:MAG TPA: cytochrome c [Ilumatobacteraceae bacterium]|nr:cytochrome c [Ilumatobacteraceae bacterium]
MSWIGRIAVIAAAVVGVVTVAVWGDGTTSRPPVATRPSLDGRSLFIAKGCATCHASRDTTPLLAGFPSLSGAASWAGARRPEMSASAYLAESMAAPSVFTSPAYTQSGGPAWAMPTLRLTPAEIDLLVAYLLQRSP